MFQRPKSFIKRKLFLTYIAITHKWDQSRDDIKRSVDVSEHKISRNIVGSIWAKNHVFVDQGIGAAEEFGAK